MPQSSGWTRSWPAPWRCRLPAVWQRAAYAARAEVGVGITGIAGPGGGTDEKPVGTVCFGFSIGGEVSSCTVMHGELGRAAVRRASVDFVFSELCRLLGIDR